MLYRRVDHFHHIRRRRPRSRGSAVREVEEDFAVFLEDRIRHQGHRVRVADAFENDHPRTFVRRDGFGDAFAGGQGHPANGDALPARLDFHVGYPINIFVRMLDLVEEELPDGFDGGVDEGGVGGC